jgi:hypothetical protein
VSRGAKLALAGEVRATGSPVLLRYAERLERIRRSKGEWP